jgi:hypothetical protein
MMNNTTTPLKKDEGRQGNLGQFGSEMKTKAQETGAAVVDKTKELASTAADKAREATSSAMHKAEDLASNVGHKAEDATASVGDGMKSLASTIREKGPHSGFAGSASASVADTLESGGRYLQEEGLKGIAEDLSGLIRRNPIPALLFGIGVGYMIARATRS